MIPKIQDMDVTDKTVIVRCDLNVPMSNGKVVDDKKIVESLETIDYLMERNCRIIIMSHFGKVKTEEDKKLKSLKPVADYMADLYPYKIYFCPFTSGEKLENAIDNLKNKEILVMENTRFEDVPDKLESNDDLSLGSYWASLGDIYVNDAFGSCHRLHASTSSITKNIPSCVGFLVQKEMSAMSDILDKPERPFTVIMGGIKVIDKVPVINSLVKKCDYLLLTGGIANTFLKALKFNVGFSAVDEESLDSITNIMVENKEKIVLPLDAVVGNRYDANFVRYTTIDKVGSDEIIFDIGTKTIEKYKSYINGSKLIFINGTPGKYEDLKYRNGTNELFTALKNSSAKVMVGGGDSVAASKMLNLDDIFYYISTGGGATLEYISKGSLPAIDILKVEEK